MRLRHRPLRSLATRRPFSYSAKAPPLTGASSCGPEYRLGDLNAQAHAVFGRQRDAGLSCTTKFAVGPGDIERSPRAPMLSMRSSSTERCRRSAAPLPETRANGEVVRGERFAYH